MATNVQGEDELTNEIRTLTSSDEYAQNILAKISTPSHPSTGTWHTDNGILYFQNLIYVPNNNALRLRLLRNHHDDPLAGHFGTTRTLELLTRNYHWPGVSKFVNSYVRSCDICQRVKPPRHAPHGELSSLPIPSKAWSGISLDFVTDLPPSGPEQFDSICVVIDRLTKMAHYIACHKTNNAAWLAKAFLKDIVRLHGLPDSIVSDRGTTFTSRFWSTICHQLRITRKLSTAFHAQTDGQTERMNQTMEQYLRAYVNYQQDDWTDWLPLAEFAYNNSRQSSTEQSPFFLNYGFHPRFNASSTPSSQVSVSFQAQEHASLIQKNLEEASDKIKHAQDIQAKYYNAKHKPLVFFAGDRVMLRSSYIHTKRPNKKLDFKQLGPFTITKVIGPPSLPP